MNTRFCSTAFMLFWAMGVVTTAWAYPQYVEPAGASGCTSCHSDSYGNGFKPGVLSAFEDDGLDGLYDFLHPNTAPVIRAINKKWDITVGEAALVIPIKVYDAEKDSFALHGSAPSGYTLSSLYTDSATKLPTINIRFAPTPAQANKLYSLKVYAQETGNRRNLNSNTVSAQIQVWPARTSATRYVSQFSLENAQWQDNKLKLAGRLVFKASTTDAQRQWALTNLAMTIKNTKGSTLYMPVKLTPSATGNWSKALTLPVDDEHEDEEDPLKPPCAVRLEYEGFKVARMVTLPTQATDCED